MGHFCWHWEQRIKTGGPAKEEIAVLGGKHFNLNQYQKWAEWELNPRHMDFQSMALPTELSARHADLWGIQHLAGSLLT